MTRPAKLQRLTSDERSWAHKAEDLLMEIREHKSIDPQLKARVDYFLEHDELPEKAN